MNHYSDIMLDKKIDRILEILKGKIIRTTLPIEGTEFCAAPYTDTNRPPEDAVWQPLTEETRFTADDSHYWVRAEVTLPECAEDESVWLSFKTGREGQWDAVNPQLLLFLDGHIVQGVDVNHTDVLVEGGRTVLLEAYFYTGLNGGDFVLRPSVQIRRSEVEALWYDLKIPYDAAKLYPTDSREHILTVRAINEAIKCLDMRDLNSEAFYSSVPAARASMKAGFYDSLCGGADAPSVTCIGHTHIDVAWQWRLCQTVEKAQRSFATVLKLMDEYPEYKFMSSQPQLYQYVKEHAPEVYEGIKARVAEGRWEAEGAMWLEADCNLSGGESLVRQILHGKQFMKKEFGVDNKLLWLPDVFGYSAALPQILKKSGVEKFVTSKISWNDMDRMPYDTFMWEGIDGTEIFTYFITAQNTPNAMAAPENYSTYVGTITPSMALGAWKRYEHKGYSDEVCITYGFGDGGGGPTREMLENQRRLAHGLPGIPKTKTDLAAAFLDRVQTSFDKNCAMTGRTPRWCGELYLQFHRGTYTTQAANKNYNRRSEFSYRTTEALAAAAMKLTGALYPADSLHKGWEIILLNQFHDIIPGSSIHEVYEDSHKQYESILSDAAAMRDAAAASVKSAIRSDREGMLVINPHSFAYTGAVKIGDAFVNVSDIPAFGWKIVTPEAKQSRVHVTSDTIENDFCRLTFANGDIVSLIDKRVGRELVKEGKALNRLCFHEDFPYCYDAWEVNEYYKDKVLDCDKVESVIPFAEGARAGLIITKKFGKSTITQKIALYDDSERIDFITEADWQEEHILLKAEFPFDIHTNEATYEIQYGSVKRPTHQNTSWDSARFEVCAQKWMDLSEDDYGVSILNDSKYGYGADGSTVTVSLLRSPTSPDPTADRGHHAFTYSLLPHACPLSEGRTVIESYKLNESPIVLPIGVQDGTLPGDYSFASVDGEGVMIEAIKRAEEDDGIILRLYEYRNRREAVELTLGFDVNKACLCDLMENEIEALPMDGHSLKLSFKPFEIITVKVK